MDVSFLNQPLSFMGMQIGVQTTMIRLSDGGLWVHSPGPGVDASLGDVRFLVAPNSMHHMNLGRVGQLYPQARLVASPGVFRKHPELSLEDLSVASWGDEIELLLVEGIPFLQEFVFFHAPSATLILTDIGFNILHSPSAWTRLALKLDGAYGCFACPRSTHLLVRDRAAFRRSVQRILQWPFERIVVGHGEVVSQDARETFREGFARRGWL